MAAAPAVIVLMSLLLLSWSCHAENAPAILLKVVEAIEKLIEFYKASYQQMNIDGIFGLKVLEGQTRAILEEHKQGQHAGLSPDIVTKLSTVVKESQWVTDRAFVAVRMTDQEYFENLAFIIAQPWTLVKQHRKITPTLRWEIPVYKSAADSMISEAESDKCMQQVRPSNLTKREGQRPSLCRLTDHCGLIMTKRGLTEYSITHQVLWTALAEKMGCHTEMNTLLKKLGFNSTDRMQEEFCTNIYYEMLAVVHVYMSGTVKSEYQDIFMEQQFICPNLGFYEFLKKKYLDQILSWQKSSGCFGDNSEEESSPQDEHPEERSPSAAVNKEEASENKKAVPHGNSLGLQQQQPHEQLNSVQSIQETDRSALLRQDSKNGHVGVLHQQNQKTDTKMGPVANSENRVIAGKERNVNNPDSVQQAAVRTGNAANSLSVNQNKLDSHHHSSNSAQRLQSSGFSGRKRESPNQNIEQAKTNTANKPPVKYSGSQNGPNAQPVKQGDGGLYQIKNIPNKREQKQQNLVQKTNSAGDTVHGVRTQGRPPEAQAPAPNIIPVLHKEGQQSDRHKRLDPYLTGHRNLRKLLVEKEMPGHCLAHKTGVAAGALVMYLRYLIDPGPLDLFGPHDFFPDASRSLLGNNGVNKDIANFLGDQKENFANGKDRQTKLKRGGLNQQVKDRQGAADGIEVEEEDEDEDEEEEDEDDEYDDKEELYPDAKEVEGPQQERKVVHFGANNLHRGHQDVDYVDNREDEKDEYTDEEEEGDYIKRVKGDDKGAENPADRDDVNEDTEYTYYDDGDDTDRGIIKRHKPQAPPQKGARIRTHNRHKPHPPSIDQVPMGLPDSPPTKTVVVFLSATSLLVVVFMYRFIRKRRISVRHNSRGFFKL